MGSLKRCAEIIAEIIAEIDSRPATGSLIRRAEIIAEIIAEIMEESDARDHVRPRHPERGVPPISAISRLILIRSAACTWSTHAIAST